MSSTHDCASFEDVKKSVCQAIGMLIQKDLILIQKNASEWAIAHRLAVYLERLFSPESSPEKWNVDCDYNRQGETRGTKPATGENYCRPDIVIHHRTKVDLGHNLLVIEIKLKAGDREDAKKVRTYTSAPKGRRLYQYQFGLVLALKQKRHGRYELDPELRWFKDGNEIRANDPADGSGT